MAKVEDRFKDNVSDVCQIVLNLFIKAKPRNSELPDPKDIRDAIDAIKVLPSRGIIESFISGSYKHWEMMETKNTENIIASAQVILPKVETSKLNMYKIIFMATDENGKLFADPNTIETVWNRFHQMVRQSITYSLEKCGNGDSTKFDKLEVKKTELLALKKKWAEMDAREKESKAKGKSP